MKKDSLYRYNSILGDLDSLFIHNNSINDPDTAFYNSFGKSEVFTLSQLLFAAVNNNPDLITIQTKLDALNPSAHSKTYLPDPMLEFELDDIMSDFKKVGMINIYISQMLPFPGKLALEKQSVLNSKSMMEEEKLAMASEIMKSIKINYYELYLLNNKLSLNFENSLLIKTFITASEAQYMVGKGMQQEIFKSQIELSRLENEKYILLQQRKNIFSELSKLTKIIIDDNTRISFNDIDTNYLLDNYSFNYDITDKQKITNYALNHRPDLKVIEYKINMNKTDVEISKLERYPDFNVKVGYKILPFEENNAFSVMLGITLPFAPWSSGKYEYNILKNEITVKSSIDELDSKKNEIKNEVNTIINNMASLKETMKFYYNVQIPQTENTMKSSQYSYETGIGSFLDLLDSYRMFQESKNMFYESLVMYLKMTAELEKAAGLSIKN
ncbi:MAG: TolC family protein [Ignavibacteria bacterium]|nr:TolC family protein [Ignavibacteria bacterium]